MLASLLPGVRDLRTPLAVGVVLLLAAWVAFGELIPGPDQAGGLLARIYDASEVLGAPSTLAVAGFVAYLIGSAWTFAIERPIRKLVRFPSGNGRLSIHQLVEADVDLAKTSEERRNAITAQLHREIPNLRYRLLAANRDIYDHFDRKESEAELRVALAVPLGILVITAAIEASPWFLFALAFVLALAIQGVSQGRAATAILTEAVVQGAMTAPSLEAARVETRARRKALEERMLGSIAAASRGHGAQ